MPYFAQARIRKLVRLRKAARKTPEDVRVTLAAHFMQNQRIVFNSLLTSFPPKPTTLIKRTTMGSQHSKNQLPKAARPSTRNVVASPRSEPVETRSAPTSRPPEEVSLHLPHSSCSVDGTVGGMSLDVTKLRPVPSKLKRFRVNVPQSMEPGDIMTIKLNGILTKILVSTPTTSTGKADAEVSRAGPSRAATSCSSSTFTPPPSRPIDNVIASTDSKVPDGKMIVDAKPVIVVHALFTQDNKELKDRMIDEAMREVIQETVSSGCNSVLGMTVSIKKQVDGPGYFIKACGTPCLLMPAQVLLGPSLATGSLRKRTSSTEITPSRRRQ